MGIIYVIDIIMIVILLGWTWSNLGTIQKNKKVIFIVIGIAIETIITLIIFKISKSSIIYPKEEMVNEVRNVLLLTFAPLNGMITMPFVAKKLEKLEFNEIDENKFKKAMMVMLIISVFIFVFECNYLNSIQSGIIDVINSK